MTAQLTFWLETLGCKVNQYEAQALREAWIAAGWREEASDPRVIVFNSCAVTARAVADLRQRVRQAHAANPSARIVLTGCAAQVLGHELRALPGIAAVVPQSAKDSLLKGPLQDCPAQCNEPHDPPADGPAQPRFPAFFIHNFKRARAVCKVQDGCSQRCTYCIVPLTRGPSRSRPLPDILHEARQLLSAGHREIVLTGVNVGEYATEDGPQDFWDLLTELDAQLAPEWSGRARLRLSSLDPGMLGNKALDTLAACRLVCPHLHLSIQSLAPAVLRRMGRHTSMEHLESFLRSLRNLWPLHGLGTDLLTGFPGETEQDAATTLDAIGHLPFTYGHVFPFSPRPGTPAARYPQRLPRAQAAQRAASLRKLLAQKALEFRNQLVSSRQLLHVVVEKDLARGMVHGMCEHYVECRFPTPPAGDCFKRLVAAQPLANIPEGHLTVKTSTANEPHNAADD